MDNMFDSLRKEYARDPRKFVEFFNLFDILATQPDGPCVDAYAVLGVPNDADKSDIKTAYRKLAIRHHPDKFTDPAEKQVRSVEFRILLAAYDALINDSTRAQYDRDRGMARSQRWDSSCAIDKRHNKRDGEYRPLKKTRRQAGILVTQGFIREQKINAMPDTGAGYNLIASSLVQALALAWPQSEALGGLNIRMANGKFLRTTGVIEAIWSFETDTDETWTLNFHVIEDFFCDAVLGNDFLLATQTMSKNQHRLSRIPPPLHALSVLYVNSLGHVTQRLRGSINNLPVDALPDSGSESNILSFEYIQRNAWGSDIDTQDMRLLLFPDGTVGRTMGSLRLHWRYGAGAEGEAVEVDFHILYGCVYDAILGEGMLDETQAFTEHQDSFVDAALHEESPLTQTELNLVIWLPSKRSKERKREDSDLQVPTVDELAATSTSLSDELKRRAAVDHVIKRMKKGRQRDDAVAEETEVRRRFDMNFEYPQINNDRRARIPLRDTSTGSPPLPLQRSHPLYDYDSYAQRSPSPLQEYEYFEAPDLEERRKRLSPGAAIHPRLLG